MEAEEVLNKDPLAIDQPENGKSDDTDATQSEKEGTENLLEVNMCCK